MAKQPAPHRWRFLWVFAAIFGVISSVGFPLVAVARSSATVKDLQIVVLIQQDRGHAAIAKVDIPSGSTSLDALKAASVALGWDPPTEDEQWPGFICSIHGLPSMSTTCLKHFSSSAKTWALWQADGKTWRYATVGAAVAKAEDRTVEGWVLEPGLSSHAKVVAPGIKPDFRLLADKATTSSQLRHQNAYRGVGGVIAAVVLLLGLLVLGSIARRRRS